MQVEVQSPRAESSVLMVVDDDDIARESVASMLVSRGFRVIAHASAQTALNALRHGEHADLILLDLVMPEMNGWEFRRRQLVDDALAAIPVVAMSGMRREQAPALPVSAFLEKPLAANDVLATVERLLKEENEETSEVRMRPGSFGARGRRAGSNAPVRARTRAKEPPYEFAVREEERRNQQMTAVSRAVSHVVNNAMQGLISYVQCATEDDAEDAELQRAAFASVAQCADVLRRFANAAQVQSARVPGALAVVPPWLLEEWRQHCQAPVELRVSGLPLLRSARVTLDVLLFATKELVENAAEALAPHRGVVHVQVTHCELGRKTLRTALPVRNRRVGAWCCVEVSDDGAGIAASELARIWSPFYSTKFADRGLGLAEVLSRVSAEGGLVDARSTLGVGTSVQLLFPLAQ